MKRVIPLGLSLACALLVGLAPTTVAAPRTLQQQNGVEIAFAFTTALNAHDVDAIVAMFTDEDSGATLTADNYAWEKFEIRRWAELQVANGIAVDAYDYSPTATGATWVADVHRADWQALGVDPVVVTNSIWVHNEKIGDFTSRLSEPRQAELLGGAWQPMTAVN